jgi:hypothetical protein
MTAADRPDLPDLPPALRERPYDHERGRPVPFVHEYDDGTYDLDHLNRKRVTQCALSRVCALCAQSLDYPLAFLGDDEEAQSRTYAYPPVHLGCAQAAVRLYPPPGAATGVRGGWVMTVTGSFQVERPSRRGQPTVFRAAPGEVRTFGS